VFFARELVDHCRSRGMEDNDIVATATAFTAQAIAEGYRRFIYPKYRLDEVVVGGGGVRNEFLMGMLREQLAPVPVKTHEDFGIASDAREALSWAVLANETLVGNPANIPQVTGAKRRVVLGKIIPA
jgi:anhydro-N-acetylmuramic acid kinase